MRHTSVCMSLEYTVIIIVHLCSGPCVFVLSHSLDSRVQLSLSCLSYQVRSWNIPVSRLSSYAVFTPEQDNDKTNVEPVHSYDAFHTRSDVSGVKGIIGMHRFNFCLVVVLLWCENTMRVKG